MGCESCSNGEGGLPAGCKNNGACGVNGCGTLDVFDWLAGMELPPGQRAFDIAEIRFKNDRKSFYRFSSDLELAVGDVVAVEASPGYDMGVITLTGELVKYQMKRRGVKDNHEIKKVYRKATDEDIEKWQEAKKLEWDTMIQSRKIANELELVMKISDVEYQGDKNKATFYYTADGRVDFRELIKRFAENFKVRIEMKQVGMRQEAGRLGGIGSCGRELCCSTWLKDFRSVSTSSARYQQLALNPQKLAGQCGKLKCCLNYELDQYMEAVKDYPSTNVKLHTEKGTAVHFKTDIFGQVIYYIYEKQAGVSPIGLNLEAVLEIIAKNKKGEKPEGLKMYEEVAPLIIEPDYANVVGQDSLTRFDRKKRSGNKKRKSRNNRNRKPKQGASTDKPQNKKGGNRPKRVYRPNRSKKSGGSNQGKK